MGTIKQDLEKAWEDGFFFDLRYGRFNEKAYQQLKYTFDTSAKEDIDVSDKRLISLLWFIPLFISWQTERLEENGVSKSIISDISNYFYNQCEQILGLP